jgi:hypothetical protein
VADHVLPSNRWHSARAVAPRQYSWGHTAQSVSPDMSLVPDWALGGEPAQNCEKNFQIAWGSGDHASCEPENRHQMLGSSQFWY